MHHLSELFLFLLQIRVWYIYDDVIRAFHDVLIRHTPYRPGVFAFQEILNDTHWVNHTDKATIKENTRFVHHTNKWSIYVHTDLKSVNYGTCWLFKYFETNYLNNELEENTNIIIIIH